MLAKEIYQLRNDLQAEGIIFCYCGYMTESVLTGIGNTIRRKLELEKAEPARAKGIFAVFVEQVQNVIRYSTEREQGEIDDEPAELRYGVLTVGQRDGKYFVACGNMVDAADVARLSEALERIQELDKEGLKALYKETLRGEVPEGSKGAGVGFIEIARKASHGFEFDFCDIDDHRAYFCLTAYL